MTTYENDVSDYRSTGTGVAQRPPDTNPRRAAIRANRDEVLRRAVKRGDRAMALVEEMRRNVERSEKRAQIERDIAERRVQERQLAGTLRAVFFLNFAVLGAVYYFGAGVGFTSAGSDLTSIGRACALVGTYLLLVQLILVGRLPLLDRLYGLDALTRWHKHNGRLSFTLIMLHAIAVTVGRAMLAHNSLGDMTMNVMSYRYMIPAVFSLATMTIAIATSVVIVRRKMDFNHWHFLHCWTYLGVALSFGHELFGPDFEGRPLAQAYIWTLYGLTFAALVVARLVFPLVNTMRYQLRVAKVVEEGPGVTSLYFKGFNLDRLNARAGQFAYWRFFHSKSWVESHPFSLSAAPGSKYLRITIKALGDFTSRIGEIPIGCWVSFEGPFGRFTHERRTSTLSLLIAGGVGITPIRSLLEGLPSANGDIVVLYRVNRIENAVLLTELQMLANQRNAQLHLVLDNNDAFPEDHPPLSAPHIRSLVPDAHRRDIYICASPGMTAAVRGTLKSMGVRSRQVHHETFA